MNKIKFTTTATIFLDQIEFFLVELLASKDTMFVQTQEDVFSFMVTVERSKSMDTMKSVVNSFGDDISTLITEDAMKSLLSSLEEAMSSFVDNPIENSLFTIEVMSNVKVS